MQRIILVGNGRSLLSRPGLGAVIDGFDVVVRFNDFRVTGFEDHVGVRTDWWARNEVPPAAPRPERFERILLRSRVECPEEHERAARTTIAELARSHAGTPVEVICRSVFTRMLERFPFRNAPLTGTLAVGHLLRRYEQVHVCGFDGLQGSPESLRHYYSEGNIVGDWTDYHDPDLDSRYLREQADQGRLVVL